MSRWLQRPIFGVFVGIAMLASACGGSSVATGSTSSANVAEAQRLAEAAMQPATYKGPTQPVDMSQVRGKTLWYIKPYSAPYPQGIADGFKEAADVAGVNVKFWEGQGQPARWNTGVATAVAQHADGIVIYSVDPQFITGPLQDAAAAHIPVISGDQDAPGEAPCCGIYSAVGRDFTAEGRIIADYMIWKSNGNAHVLWLTATVFRAAQQNATGFSGEMNRLCPSCTYVEYNIDPSTQNTAIPGIVASLLRSHPEINWFQSYDSVFQYALAGVRLANEEGKISGVGYDGVPFNLTTYVAPGLFEVADIGVPLHWHGWAHFDAMARALSGQKPTFEFSAYRLIDKSNVSTANGGAASFGSFDYQSAFKKLWGLG